MNEAERFRLLTTPSDALVGDMAGIDGDVLVIGAGGKMGPTLCVLLQNALRLAGRAHRVWAASRFTESGTAENLRQNGVEPIACDLLGDDALSALPAAAYVVYMAGRKFGTVGAEAQTWAMNAWLPARVAERYRHARIVVFSSGNIYPYTDPRSGGATEETAPDPVGEYAMSTLARERMFEYAADAWRTPVALLRLNYAVDLSYGVLHDIARDILDGRPLTLSMPCFNCIWQGDANEAALRLLTLASPEVFRLNVTGPETVSLISAARALGDALGTEPRFEGEPAGRALLSNAGKMFRLFGYPRVPLGDMIAMQAEWMLSGGRSLGKPTHFNESGGRY